MDKQRRLQRKVFRVVQFGSNVAIIVLCVVFTILVLKEYLISPRTVVQSNSPPVASSIRAPVRAAQTNLNGTVMPLNVDWETNKSTVVLNLSTTCHFCQESTEFYQRLAQARMTGNFKLVVVFPQSSDQATEYLNSHQIKADQVVSGSLSSIGVTATPTLMLVSEGGVIYSTWRGKLDEKGEAEVISKISS